MTKDLLRPAVPQPNDPVRVGHHNRLRRFANDRLGKLRIGHAGFSRLRARSRRRRVSQTHVALPFDLVAPAAGAAPGVDCCSLPSVSILNTAYCIQTSRSVQPNCPPEARYGRRMAKRSVHARSPSQNGFGPGCLAEAVITAVYLVSDDKSWTCGSTARKVKSTK